MFSRRQRKATQLDALNGAMEKHEKIEAIIRLSRLDEIQRDLGEIGVDAMTVCEVKEFGRHNRHTETCRGSEYTVDFLPNIKIDLVGMEEIAERTVKVIMQSARTGELGENKVFISDVEKARCTVAV